MTLLIQQNLGTAWGVNTAIPDVADIGPLILIRRRILYDIALFITAFWSLKWMA